MKRKILVFIVIIVIPFLILVIDHFVFHEDISLDAFNNQSTDWQYIVKHQSQYPTSLLKLAMHNEETIPFVANYLHRNEDLSKNLHKDLKNGEIPLLLQWDERWGYEKYGNEMMAINGCGPTCLSMVLSYLKQNPQYNPYCIAQFSYQKGYYGDIGTSWELMSEGAKFFGLNVQQLSLDEQLIQNELNQGHPIICSVTKGDFTSDGHFIVLKEYRDGLIYVNDPNSVNKSQTGYRFNELYSQIKNLWVYSL